jgi:hypothetical protein
VVCPGYSFNAETFKPAAAAAECLPYGADTVSGRGGYVMFPSVATPEATEFGERLSRCSAETIGATAAAQGSCLTEPTACAYGGGACEPHPAVSPTCRVHLLNNPPAGWAPPYNYNTRSLGHVH